MKRDGSQCPICNSDKTVDIASSLHECVSCRIVFNSQYAPKQYNDTYFLDEYEKQYGKTYINDFHNIYTVSKKRLHYILRYIPSKKKLSDIHVLDIGSAAGFFLKCVQDLGIQNVLGIEISEYASGYCRETFKIPVIQASFDAALLDRRYDVITAWFFIEHCADTILIIKKIHNSLNEDGIFAFSVPSYFGPLYKFNRNVWAQTHPEDHRIDFSPYGMKKLLKRFGFKKIYIKPAGFHPERVFSNTSNFFKAFSRVYSIYSNLTAFSDTIEVYAVK